MLKSDLYRLLRRPHFYISSMAILVLIFLEWRTDVEYLAWAGFYRGDIWKGIIEASYYPTSYNTWAGFSPGGWGSVIYKLIFPLLISLPSFDLFVEDGEKGLIRQFLIREDYKDYNKSHYMTSFLSGGLIGSSFFIIHLLISFMIFPSIRPTVFNSSSHITENTFLYPLFYRSPLFYEILNIGKIFLFSGLMAIFSLSIGKDKKNRLKALFYPFLYSLIFENLKIFLDRIFFEGTIFTGSLYQDSLLGTENIPPISLLYLALMIIYVIYIYRKGEDSEIL